LEYLHPQAAVGVPVCATRDGIPGYFCFLPMISAFYYSLTDYNLLSPPVFVGLKGYERMINDPRFLVALKNTFVYAFGSTIRSGLSRLGWH